MNVFAVTTNFNPEKAEILQSMFGQLSKNEKIKAAGTEFHIIAISSIEKCKVFFIIVEERKCTNFIEEYVDGLKAEITQEISKLHARQLVER